MAVTDQVADRRGPHGSAICIRSMRIAELVQNCTDYSSWNEIPEEVFSKGVAFDPGAPFEGRGEPRTFGGGDEGASGKSRRARGSSAAFPDEIRGSPVKGVENL